MKTTQDTEVLIVGAGPAGLMLANILGMYGKQVTVLEAMDTLIDYPRGVGLDDESFRTIQTVGLVDAIRPHTNPQHIMRLVNGAGKVMLVNNPQTVEFGWERKHGFIQPEADKALYEGLSRFGNVQVLFGHRVENVEEDGQSVTAIALVSRPDGTIEERRFSAQYLVGCEGGKSPTRKRLGVSFEGESPSTRWLVVDVNNDPLGTPNVFLGADPKRPYVSIGLPHAVRRWEFMLHDDETEEQVTDPDYVNALLADHVPNPAELDFIRRRVFTHHGRVASDFRKGRQLIAGDAAHLMPVWMGQGWNSGMRDATNLGWKLAAVLSGQADDALLDTYTSERKDHAQAMVDLSLTFGRLIKITNPVGAVLRDAASSVLNLFPQVKSYFADMRFKPMPRYTRGVLADPNTRESGSAAAKLTSKLIPVLTANVKNSPVGVQFPQPRVNSRDASDQLLDDAIGNWWSVIVWGNSPKDVLPQDSLDKLSLLGARLVAVVPETQREWAQKHMDPDVMVLGDHTGRLKKWFDDRPTPLVFLRPDRFVAGACLTQHAPATLDAILAAMKFTPAGAVADAVAVPVAL
ncbi:bifunctional 3-(3-hydroxy-phenyl)propionate/3-hydroxycinnamic acid hydroxylase [Rhodococcus sp. AD45-ID]|uniref:bifunctional 3-(3-hydroxy-phenyl)propionate/3-hydroxycinnamic acid hydroxylase MhpA n=1 Tax=unclassified Rhodococcus (in: high G+C Gram-positive bacteria) TaxID=192944 RepID=UPI0005D4400C|nr:MULTISPECIES: bifunctional 3-(3-hydroxy-phenyl)propionate/3-hydroxycinnamic acid hydroxylase [unclassified Rhodococcus (in: high G+C Gram-positive bacteria)]KJF24593.1 3-(3-hydroxy-phenyl)propionate/3-hydroxycinnamic acid hydroxylase [Rhodococcus sp. AD45]PSR42864.1 bifunctional 3-(3-hydroxy-phenyl)propionate/3-hydroxycinnamic acid hydroxylase [Rhodococcus sp. AD45-ID]